MIKLYFFNKNIVILEIMVYWLKASLFGAGSLHPFPNYPAIGAIWFLWATFWGSCFLYAVKKLNIYIKYVVVVIIFLIGYFTKDLFWFPLSVQPGCYALLWMCVGNCIWEEKDVLEKAINSISKETVFLGGILIFAVWVEFIINWWPHGGKIFSLASCDIGRGIPDIVSSLCGCYCVFIIAQIIQKYNNISKIFLLCGRYSLLILCIHIVELNLFPWGKILSYLGVDVINNIFIFLIILLKCLFIFFVLALCLKCMFIKKLFEYSSYK